eukprot:6304506-Pyramimonas_sp.AAC.1
MIADYEGTLMLDRNLSVPKPVDCPNAHRSRLPLTWRLSRVMISSRLFESSCGLTARRQRNERTRAIYWTQTSDLHPKTRRLNGKPWLVRLSHHFVL